MPSRYRERERKKKEPRETKKDKKKGGKKEMARKGLLKNPKRILGPAIRRHPPRFSFVDIKQMRVPLRLPGVQAPRRERAAWWCAPRAPAQQPPPPPTTSHVCEFMERKKKKKKKKRKKDERWKFCLYACVCLAPHLCLKLLNQRPACLRRARVLHEVSRGRLLALAPSKLKLHAANIEASPRRKKIKLRGCAAE
jgi:hypothetical protein